MGGYSCDFGMVGGGGRRGRGGWKGVGTERLGLEAPVPPLGVVYSATSCAHGSRLTIAPPAHTLLQCQTIVILPAT